MMKIERSMEREEKEEKRGEERRQEKTREEKMRDLETLGFCGMASSEKGPTETKPVVVTPTFCLFTLVGIEVNTDHCTFKMLRVFPPEATKRLCGGVARAGGQIGVYALLRGNWAGMVHDFYLDW